MMRFQMARFEGPYKRIPWKYKSDLDDEVLMASDIGDILREILERLEDLERTVDGTD
jgi:hypothetical protein